MAGLMAFMFFAIYILYTSVWVVVGSYFIMGAILSAIGSLLVYRRYKEFAFLWRILLLYPLVMVSESKTRWLRQGYYMGEASKNLQDECDHEFDNCKHSWCPKCGLRRTHFDPPIELEVSNSEGEKLTIKELHHRSKGFTAIELLLVIVVMGLTALVMIKCIEKDPPAFPARATNVQELGDDWYYFDLDGNTYLMRDAPTQNMIARVRASAEIHVKGEE
jgi:prepilin-type N-terminal cleavage/methylation domain-containing protein